MDTKSSFYEAQVLIDREIGDLTAHMQYSTARLLKTRRNELAPAYKLPNEILLYIFLISRDSTDLHPKNWHQVTHICRYWRDVAIGSPSLWIRLYNPPHALALLMLQRSQKAPLDIHFTPISFRGKLIGLTLTAILQEIERIQSLTFLGIPTNLMDAAQTTLASLGREASLLEELKVTIDDSIHALELTSLRFALDVFRPTRLLRTLSLSGLKYEWNIFPLPNLTYLDLGKEIIGETSGAQFAEALRQMPNLEFLYIDWNAIHLSQSILATTSQPIKLPCLKTLDIFNAPQDHVKWLLSQITHPRLQQLTFDSPLPMANNVEMCRLIKSSIENGDFRMAEFKFLRINSDNFTVSAHPETSKDGGAFVDIYVPVRGGGHETDVAAVSNILSCIASFGSNNPLPPLRHLSLQDFHIPVDEFIRLFAYLPHLEAIEIRQNLAALLWKVLAPTPSPGDATANTSIPFPKLRSIIWHGLHKFSPGHSVPILSSTAFSAIYSSLLCRRAQAAAVTKLELVGCERLNEIQENQLKEIGVEIIARKNDW